MLQKIKALWNGIRFIMGDDAYDRYVKHWQAHHRAEGVALLERKVFLKQELDKKWNSGDIKRCC